MPCLEPQGATMRRREFIRLLGSAATAWPFGAHAQQLATPVIGFLSGLSPGPFAQRLAAFRQGLNETGIIEGRNVAIEYRWAEGQYDRLPALAADLVGRRVVVIVAWTDAAALAAKATTTTIPIVFLTGSDPVRFGLVPSLSRPAENITGVSWFGIDLVPKQLSLLHELVPNAAIIALLVDANIPEAVSQVSEVQAAARTAPPSVPCPLWVKSRHSVQENRCSLCPQKRTSAERIGMSAKCHKQTWSRSAALAPVSAR